MLITINTVPLKGNLSLESHFSIFKFVLRIEKRVLRLELQFSRIENCVLRIKFQDTQRIYQRSPTEISRK